MSRQKNVFDLKNEDIQNQKVKKLSNRKKFHPHDLISLKALSESQKLFFDLYFNEEVPIILQKGSAGTGKTCIALYAALTEVFDQSKIYEKIVIFRSAVETRKVGFLPGSLEEKAMIYELPYKSLSSFLIKDFNEPYNHLKSLGYIDFQITSYQRGTTYDNCIMLIDEAQNLDRDEILTILSRVGQNSRILICGDSKQSDLERHRENSCFAYLEKLMLNIDYSYSRTVEYSTNDIVRSGLAKKILIADSSIHD